MEYYHKNKKVITLNKLIVSLIIAFYTLAIVTQLLVLLKIIPYTSVNGGMSTSYSVQAVQSTVSILITGVLFSFIWKIIKKYKTRVATWQVYATFLITFFWILGLILQILGTDFEKYVLSGVLLIGVVGHSLLCKSIVTKGKIDSQS